MPDPAPIPNLPLRLGSPAEFTTVREFFRQAAFNDANLCRLLAIPDLGQLGAVRWNETPADRFTAPLRWCVDVFVRGLKTSAAEARAQCGDSVCAALRSLGLLVNGVKDPAAVVCPVWVYPAAGFICASDRRDDPEGGVLTPPEDVVFPAIYGGTLRFLKLLPEQSRGDALDLCGGTGIGAFQLARTARSSATADLTPRSAWFAEFNARLNGLPVESLCGDLYSPAAGRQFDFISAHPPFVPATGTNMVYRDGGDTGEEVTRRVIEGLPAHLRPNGTAVVLCVARDTNEGNFEQRVWQWLGPARDEFELVFGLEKILSVEEVVESMSRRGQCLSADAARQLLERLRSLNTRRFVYGAVWLQRTQPKIPVAPIRVQMTPDARAAHFEHALAWQRFTRSSNFNVWLASSKPTLAPALELTARHGVRENQLVPLEFMFAIHDGFEAALRLDGWIIPLIARFQGSKSVRQIFDEAHAAAELPEGFPFEAFADLVQKMVERGFLKVTTIA